MWRIRRESWDVSKPQKSCQSKSNDSWAMEKIPMRDHNQISFLAKKSPSDNPKDWIMQFVASDNRIKKGSKNVLKFKV